MKKKAKRSSTTTAKAAKKSPPSKGSSRASPQSIKRILETAPMQADLLPAGSAASLQSRLFPEAPKDPAKVDDRRARQALGDIAKGLYVYRASLAQSAHLLKEVIQAKTEVERTAAWHMLEKIVGSIGDIGSKLAQSIETYDQMAPYFGIQTWGALLLSPRHRALRDRIVKSPEHKILAELYDGGKIRQMGRDALKQIGHFEDGVYKDDEV